MSSRLPAAYRHLPGSYPRPMLRESLTISQWHSRCPSQGRASSARLCTRTTGAISARAAQRTQCHRMGVLQFPRQKRGHKTSEASNSTKRSPTASLVLSALLDVIGADLSRSKGQWCFAPNLQFLILGYCDLQLTSIQSAFALSIGTNASTALAGWFLPTTMISLRHSSQ